MDHGSSLVTNPWFCWTWQDDTSVKSSNLGRLGSAFKLKANSCYYLLLKTGRNPTSWWPWSDYIQNSTTLHPGPSAHHETLQPLLGESIPNVIYILLSSMTILHCPPPPHHADKRGGLLGSNTATAWNTMTQSSSTEVDSVSAGRHILRLTTVVNTSQVVQTCKMITSPLLCYILKHFFLIPPMFVVWRRSARRLNHSPIVLRNSKVQHTIHRARQWSL
jgi:hypothetical protein